MSHLAPACSPCSLAASSSSVPHQQLPVGWTDALVLLPVVVLFFLIRQVVPMVCRLLAPASSGASKGSELRQASAALLRACRAVLGDDGLRRAMAPGEFAALQEHWAS